MKRSNVKPRVKASRLCAIILLLVVGTSNPSTAETSLQLFERLAEAGENDLRKAAVVFFASVAAPAGKFLLIRKGSDMCAVRFTSFRRGHDAKPPTLFWSGAERKFAEFDWYYQGDGSGNFTDKNIQFGHTKLQLNPTWGYAHMTFQTGQTAVKCGRIRLVWHYPYIVTIYPGGKLGDFGFELAPTAWDKIDDVDAGSPLLKWYRYEEDRKPLVIPSNDLVGSEKTKK